MMKVVILYVLMYPFLSLVKVFHLKNNSCTISARPPEHAASNTFPAKRFSSPPQQDFKFNSRNDSFSLQTQT